VAWEERHRGGRYYYRTHWVEGRPVKEYVGTGPFAEIIAASDRTGREIAKAEREQEKARNRRELERLEALAAPVLELGRAVEVLVRAHLIAAGYHRHKGEYRRARGGARST
jgi:hypothetical protein